MIEGTLKKDEKTYRGISLDSSSSLKDFSMDRKKYFRKYLLGENVEDKDTQANIMGRVVETLLLEPELFDERFYLSVCLNAPTGLMLDFVEALYKVTTENTNEEGDILKDFESISKEAYSISGFKLPYETVIKKFAGSDAEIYYSEILNVRRKSLTIVTAQDVNNAERIVEELKNNPITSGIVNLVNSDRWEVHNQYQIEGFEVDGLKMKGMIDKLVIDHKEKTIQIYDLKCTWSVENFYSEYYLYRRAYIQAFVYHRAVITTTEYQDYEVLPPKFIVCDSTNYYSPLIYALTEKDLNDAYLGFEHNGKEYPGVWKIIKDLQWAIENNIWNISRENYLNKGIVSLKD